MNIPKEWLSPTSVEEAVESQRIMAQHVLAEDCISPPLQYIGGMDVSNSLYDPNYMIYASAVLISPLDFHVVEQSSTAERQLFPYIPGLLGFREAPALVRAFSKISHRPDLMMIDGHGISHPRGLGIASHIGVLLDIPTIGVAKTILVGEPESPLGEDVGSTTPLIWKGRTVAMMLRTKKRARPIIISVGHKISLPTAVEMVSQMLHGYRLPEPTRQAHIAANAFRKQEQSKK